MAIAIGRRPLHQGGLGLVVAVALGAGFTGGRDAAADAYNECVVRGPDVQQAIEEERNRAGAPPDSLADVYSNAVPCSRPLRGTLLNYRRTGDETYQLAFGDWLTSWSGD